MQGGSTNGNISFFSTIAGAVFDDGDGDGDGDGDWDGDNDFDNFDDDEEELNDLPPGCEGFLAPIHPSWNEV